jgi:5S rRNA maturation endonuclease (ribonuclease M5)
MANHRARSLLRGEDISLKTVVIVEGVPDFLTAGVEDPESAVFGIVQGSWQPMHAERIPPGTDVVIATDQDPPGEKLAATVEKTLSGRRHGRWRPHANPLLGKEKQPDVNDAGGIAGGTIEWHE